MKQPDFLQKPLEQMTTAEWESLCDGCGLCCQIRVEDEDTGEIALSNVACRQLCLNSHQCKDYAHRFALVPDCTQVTPATVHSMHWLPATCGYRLVAYQQPLPSWHPLICGDAGQVHKKGPSMMGSIISEDDAEWE